MDVVVGNAFVYESAAAGEDLVVATDAAAIGNVVAATVRNP